MAIKTLVVGGTNGIGYAMACRVAGETPSSEVMISGRNKPKDIPHANIVFQRLDASLMKDIKQYTDDFKAKQGDSKLDLLILTQGIMSVAGRSETSEGIDVKMALHYYGRQLLIRELLPVLADDAKVLIVLKGKYGKPSMLLWDDLDLKTHFSLIRATNHNMAMTDAMVQYYATEQQKTPNAKRHFVHAWPGVVDSNILNGAPWMLKKVLPILRAGVAKTPAASAKYLLNGTMENAAEGETKGRYWSNIDSQGQLVPNKPVWDQKQMRAVAQHTWELVDSIIGESA